MLQQIATSLDPNKLELTFGTYLRNALTHTDKTGKTYLERFVQEFLTDAINDPSGKCGIALSSGIIGPNMYTILDGMANKNNKEERDLARFRIRETLYKQQQEVFDDLYSNTIMVICSRRAGKTELNCRLIASAVLQGLPVLYLNKTFSNAVNQAYDKTLSILKEYTHLNIKESSKADGYIKFTEKDCKDQDDMQIRYAGLADISSLDALRGFHFGLVIIDEVGHIKNGDYLINEVVSPMLADYKNSRLVLTGTPPRTRNYATRLWHNSNIKHYHWTAKDNPFIPDFQEYIDRKCRELGYVNSDGTLNYEEPFIQREYYGNMDAYDTKAMVFDKYVTYDDSNIVDIFQKQEFFPDSGYIGVDFGYTDPFAVVAFLYDSVRNKAYVTKVFSQQFVGSEQQKVIIRKMYLELGDLLSTYGYDIKRVKIVTDTNEPDVAYDLYKSGLPVVKAYKTNMMSDVERLAARLRTGQILIPKSLEAEESDLITDLKCTIYKRDDETDELINEIDDMAYHPNAVHALRYAARNAFEHGTSPAKALNTNPTIPNPDLEYITNPTVFENETSFADRNHLPFEGL